MGFPFAEATWNAVTGAMFIGAGGVAPGVYTFIGGVICVAILWYGYIYEKGRYQDQ